jgi:hypothetical protein
VKRLTQKQATREWDRREMGSDQQNQRDPRMDDGEDEDDEYPGRLSDSDEESTPETFI